MLTILKDSAFMIAPCMRGFGYSTYTNPIKGLKDLAEDLKLLLDENFSWIEKYYIFGHGIGAAVAVHLALLDPSKVKGICMLNPIRPDGIQSDYKVTKMEQVKDFENKKELYDMGRNKDKDKYHEWIKKFNLPQREEIDMFMNLITLGLQKNYWDIELL